MRRVLLLLLLGVAFAQLSVLLWQKEYAAQQYAALQTDIRQLDQALENETTLSQAIGALQVLGLSGRTIKEQALGLLPDNDPEALKRLAVIQQLYQVDGVYILDKVGKIVAHQTQGKSSLGNKVPWRPYFKQAMKGIANVYPAVGSASGERGLYFAVPIFAEASVNSDIIGVMMLKKSLDRIDEILAGYQQGHALLLSPQGVVFASNHQEWLYHLKPPVSDQQLREIVAQKQFGKTFEGEQPQIATLPFSWSSTTRQTMEWQNSSYTFSESKVDWSDPLGAWQLLVLRPIDVALAPAKMLLVYLGVPILVLLIGLFIDWQRRQWQRRHQTEKQIREAEARIAVLVQSVDDGIVGVDNHGKLIFANPAAMRLLGFVQRTILLSHSLSELLFTQDADAFKRSGLFDAIRYGEKRQLTLTYHTQNGVERLLDLTMLPLKTHDGWDGFVLVFRDMSEQQRIQTQMQQQMNELMQMNRVAVDRELNMIALKAQINVLLIEAGKEAIYVIAE